MTINEILEGFRSGELEIKQKCGMLDEETEDKILKLQTIFDNSGMLRFKDNSVEIMRLYYMSGYTIEEIAEILYLSPRTVYRKKNAALEWLSDFIE